MSCVFSCHEVTWASIPVRPADLNEAGSSRYEFWNAGKLIIDDSNEIKENCSLKYDIPHLIL